MSHRIIGRAVAILALLSGAVGGDAQENSTEASFSSYRISNDMPRDAALEEYLEPYRQGVEAFSRHVLGYATEPLTRSSPESGLTNLVADALLTIGREEFEVEVDFAITNYGGLRRDLPQGPLTMGLLVELSPFNNYMTLLEVDGELAIEAAKAVARGGVAVAGMEVERDADGGLVVARIGGEPIEASRRYRMVTIDYLVATWPSLFDRDRIFSQRVSENLLQRDAIALHLGRLNDQGIRIENAGDGRVKTN